MDKKKFAFVGKESYEVALFLGKLYQNLGYNITYLDLSPKKDLLSCIPGVDYAAGSTEYSGMNFMWTEFDEDLPEFTILYFGFNVTHPLIKQCDEVWIFTDYQLQNLNMLKNLDLTPEQARFAVFFRDDTYRMSSKLILEELRGLNISNENFIEIERSNEEFKHHCQYDSTIRWQGGIKTLKVLAQKFFESDFTKAEITAALKGGKKK